MVFYGFFIVSLTGVGGGGGAKTIRIQHTVYSLKHPLLSVLLRGEVNEDNKGSSIGSDLVISGIYEQLLYLQSSDVIDTCTRSYFNLTSSFFRFSSTLTVTT
jgi:hypothetical protein